MTHVSMVLALAEDRLAEINAFLQRQDAIIENLSAAGSDTTSATALLLELERIQARRIGDRNRLRQALRSPLTASA